MADQDTADVERAKVRAAIAALSAAYRTVADEVDRLSAQIEALPDPQEAFEYASEVADTASERMRSFASQTSELRARMVGRIWKAEELSLAQLASRIGVSKQRADQLVKAAQRSTNPPSEPED